MDRVTEPVKKAPDPVHVAVGKVAQASRNKRQQPGALEEARRELLEARLNRAINEALHPEEPYTPITKEQRKRMAAKLLGKEKA